MEKIRVWYIPQVPGKPCYFHVSSVEEGIVVAKAIIKLSIFEFENKIKPDYSDAIGMETFEDGEWNERENENGECIDDILE